MATRSQIIRAENELTEWIKNKQVDDNFTREEIKFILSDKLHDMIKIDHVHAIHELKKEDAQFEKVAEELLNSFGITISIKDIKKHITDDNLLFEIKNDTFTDTDIIEKIADTLSRAIVGSPFPMFGDKAHIKHLFFKKAIELKFIKEGLHGNR